MFVVVYALALERIDVHPLPEDMETLDPEKVYYFVYADDLALLSCNLSRVNIALSKLHRILPEYGMAVNAGKTCWMPFVPVHLRYRVPLPDTLGVSLDTEWLACVDRFPYLGYEMNLFLGNNDHVAKRRELMLSAARCTGELLRRLHITNLNSIRTFFFAMVASQQYGVAVINFNTEDFRKAAKVFLQTIFCLPDSFPYAAVEGLLRIRGFDLTVVQQRLSFIERGFRDGSVISKVLDLDRVTLSREGVGLTHDLVQVLGRFFDVSELEDLDIRDFTYLQDLRDQLVRQLDEAHFLAFARSTGLSFWTSLADDAFMPSGFGDALGSVEYECARVIILVLGDVFRYSLAAASSRCPFCPIEFHTPHLFLCPNCPFQQELPRWSSFLQMFRTGQWGNFFALLFTCLRVWARRTRFFSDAAISRFSEYKG